MPYDYMWMYPGVQQDMFANSIGKVENGADIITLPDTSRRYPYIGLGIRSAYSNIHDWYTSMPTDRFSLSTESQ